MSVGAVRIISQLQEAAGHNADWRTALTLSEAQNIHLAVMSEPFLSYVLTGKKTVESRFSLKRIAPYNKIIKGDLVLMKAGPLVGCFTVSWVHSYDLSRYLIVKLQEQYGSEICGDRAFWKRKADKRYATLLGISDVQKLTPLNVAKTDRRAWVPLGNLTSTTA